jgi:hypothetical protein
MLMPSEVDRFLHAAGLLERDIEALAYPVAGERLSAWLGRAARTRDVREAIWLAISLGLIGGPS